MKALLEEIGLTSNEVKVYLALNGLGVSTISPIVNKAGISNSKIYIILEKLINKGLVSHVLINRVKHYKTADPRMLLQFMQEKKKKIEEQEEKIHHILPSLVLAHTSATKEREVDVYEGFQGLKTQREHSLNLLKKGDEILVLGASKFSASQFEHYWENYHKRRIAKGIRCRFLMYEETRKGVGRKREQWKLTKVKYLQNTPTNPVRIDMYSDYVAIAIDAQNPFVILVKSKEVRASFEKYFEDLWKIAK